MDRQNNFSTTNFGGEPFYSQVDDDSSVHESIEEKRARFSNHPDEEHHYDQYDDEDEVEDKRHQVEELEEILLALDQLEVVQKSETLNIEILNRARVSRLFLG